MKMSQRLVTGVAALGLVGGLATFAAAPAQAAAASCTTQGGTTSTENINAHGLPDVSGGTIFTKASGSCVDFNLTKGTNGTKYIGWLEGSDDNWSECTAKEVTFNGSSIVLCSSVLAGTREAVTTAGNTSGLSITIED